MGAVKERTFDLLGVRMEGGPDSRYGPSIVNEPYHAGTFDLIEYV